MSTLDRNKENLRTHAEVHNKEVANKFIELEPLAELNNPEVKKHFIIIIIIINSSKGTNSINSFATSLLCTSA